jgi:hypothetical protein
LLGTAAGLYFWNDQRHESWSAEHAELAATPDFEAQLARDPALWQRAQASNQRLESIQSADVATWLVAGAGIATLGVGVWALLGRPSTESRESSAQSAQLSLTVAHGFAPQLQWQGTW